MLYWAIFTVGYIAGVVITLKFFVRKESTSEYIGFDSSDPLFDSSDVWETHSRLIRVNMKDGVTREDQDVQAISVAVD